MQHSCKWNRWSSIRPGGVAEEEAESIFDNNWGSVLNLNFKQKMEQQMMEVEKARDDAMTNKQCMMDELSK